MCLADEKFKEQKEVAEPKFNRKLDLDKKLEDKTGVSEPKYSKS